MNNSQFRKLVLDTPARQALSEGSNSTLGTTPRRDGPTPSALGSRLRNSIPMTPRSIGGADFARQLAERNASSSRPPTKKFRSAAAPKGAKLPEGYVDRARMRAEEEVADDKYQRLAALEEIFKEKQIDFPTFVKLRNEILSEENGKAVGKGLNFKVEGLDDVLGGDKAGEEGLVEEDVDDEFEELESIEVKAVAKDQTKKKGEMAPPSLNPSKKRNRDQILAEMKAARQAAKEAAGPSLGAKFKKVGEKKSASRIETDSKGREVLITIDENGNEKRKVRKVDLELKKRNELLVPDKDAKPLGMVVPDVQLEEEDEDINIFDDAGDDYDPLAGLGEDDEESDEEGEVSDYKKDQRKEKKPELGIMAPPPRPKPAAAMKNYFGEAKTEDSSDSRRAKASQDPVLLAAIKKAATLNPIAKEAENTEEAAKEARRKKMLQQDDRDAQDMDMGFGSSRFEDEADFDDQKVKLSEWGGKGGDDEDDDGRGDGKSKRKRGPKKRKGDSNSAADVMRVLEQRKAAKK